MAKKSAAAKLRKSAAAKLRKPATAQKKPAIDDDTMCTGPEDSWWDAEKEFSTLQEYCQNWTGSRWLSVLDVFSYHQGMAGQIGPETYVAMDIRLDEARHDLTTKRGMLLLVGLLMALVPGALCCLAPPCSLFVWLSCSVHQRHSLGPYGNVKNRKVRLANRIVLNTVAALRCVMFFRSFYMVIEQPKGSRMYDLPEMKSLLASRAMHKHLTYMGYWGGPILKPTWIMTDLSGASALDVKMTNKVKSGLKLDDPSKYFVISEKSISGKKTLGLTAKWPERFCRKVAQIWRQG